VAEFVEILPLVVGLPLDTLEKTNPFPVGEISIS